MKFRTFPLPVCLALLGAPAFSKYPEKREVEVKLNTMVNPGWVITAQRISGPQIHCQYVPTRKWMTLLHLAGAPLGTEVEILSHSPIPEGWCKIATRIPYGYVHKASALTYRIKNISSEPTALGCAAATTKGDLVFDFAAIDWKRLDQEKAEQALLAKLKKEAEAESLKPKAAGKASDL